jgi:molecular chaperone GrpE
MVSRGESKRDILIGRARAVGLLALAAKFSETSGMNENSEWKVPKWPFLLGDGLLLGFAYFIVVRSPHPIGQWEIIGCFVSAALGAVIGCLPFILDYRAIGKMIDVNALGAVAEKIQNLEKLAAQISSATNQWASVQGIVQASSDKTVAAAKGIADKMAAEVKEFSEFMAKMNDSEKTALRLEVEKMRRGEMESLQVLVRILDHVFALHAAAVRTGDPRFAEPITNFQNACRDAARRLGLAPFVAEAGEPFNLERHQVAGGNQPPSAGATITETINTGYTFQGKLLRPALVRLQEDSSAASEPESNGEQTSQETPAEETVDELATDLRD